MVDGVAALSSLVRHNDLWSVQPERNLFANSAPFCEVFECADGECIAPRVQARARTRTRAGWQALLEGTNVCFAPLPGLDEAAAHAHNAARGVFAEVGGQRQPAPALVAHPCTPANAWRAERRSHHASAGLQAPWQAATCLQAETLLWW